MEQNNSRLHTLLNRSRTDLQTALNSQVWTLQQQLTESQKQTTTLRNQLQTLQQETASARTSLKTANDELQKAAASYKQYEILRRRTQQRLERQRNLWMLAAGVLGGSILYKTII